MIACPDDNPDGEDFFSWLIEPEEANAGTFSANDDDADVTGELHVPALDLELERLENERLRREWLGQPPEVEIVCDCADVYTIQLDDEDEGFDFVLEDRDG